MPTPTYTLIQEQVLASPAASVTFSSIPQTYKDLVLETQAVNSAGVQHVYARFNGDSGTNYSQTYMTGNGSAASSGRDTSVDRMMVSLATNSVNGYGYASLMNYSNSSVNKTVLVDQGMASWGIRPAAGLWRNTTAITSITLNPDNGGTNFTAGSTFRLWGIVG